MLSMDVLDKGMALSGIQCGNVCVFAAGADLKSRASFSSQGRLFFTQENADLAFAQNFNMFLESVVQLKKTLGLAPDIVAHDPHPSFFSTQLKNAFFRARVVAVQHHHAHIASIMAQSENQDDVIGISFDGTGWGLDGNIWGGEFLAVSKTGFKRCGHLEYMKMPGGEMAVRQPWRMAFSLLYNHFGEKVFKYSLPCLKLRPRPEYALLQSAMDKNINVSLTSSCGRLFDAVSSMLGITHVISFEAEAAINLERLAVLSNDDQRYLFSVSPEEKGVYIIRGEPVIEAILSDLKRRVPAGVIARRFHASLAGLIAQMALLLRNDLKINRVALGGGVFQNTLLAGMAVKILRDEGFEVLKSPYVPLNDLGICVGQTYVALQDKRGAC